MSAPSDEEFAEALTAFARRALPAGADVRVVCDSGIARISGRVGLPRDARAIVDLLRCHDGVLDVIDELVVGRRPAPVGDT